MSLLLLTVTLRGVSNKHCLLSFFFHFLSGQPSFVCFAPLNGNHCYNMLSLQQLLCPKVPSSPIHCPLYSLHFTFCSLGSMGSTIMILSFRTDRSGQTVQTQIRLLIEEQSDQGLRCLLFHLHLFYELP